MSIDQEKLNNQRHSLAHLLASAVLEMYPDAQLGVGPTIENGFYYDFLVKESIPESALPKIEKRMRELIKQDLGFDRQEQSFDEAKKFFEQKNQPFKVELINDIEKFGTSKADRSEDLAAETSDGKVSLYQTGEFIDLCRGGHVEKTKEIDSESFKLDKIAGAYWRGDENNPQMQRIYGLAFESKEELDAYIEQRKEAEKRDHKKLGPQMDLFTFSNLVGAGLPLWTPRGTLVRNLLDNLVWELRHAKGYEQVDIPHITKKDLYEVSGHWDKFKDELFRITTREGHEFAMKPMNCPHHTQIYARKKWSYRELPQRYANTTKVYRDEQSGELAGLTRVRAFTQDDAHVFCRISQAEEELTAVWEIIENFYQPFGFELKVRLSVSDPEKPDNYLGDKKLWAEAEKILKSVADNHKTEVIDGTGEAAFYGPKLDFIAKDGLGREWQVATIQLDMNMPERFDLTCTNEQGEDERIVMIHAAIMGSIERFLGILIEHTAGTFPVWLSPIQATVLPVAEAHSDFAHSVIEEIKQQLPNARLELDNRSESISKRVREAAKQKVPYILVIGDKEVEAKTVSVRGRGDEDLGAMPITEFSAKLSEQIKNRS